MLPLDPTSRFIVAIVLLLPSAFTVVYRKKFLKRDIIDFRVHPLLL
jgi:hypothetical protein